MFLIVVGVFSYLIYRFTGIINALIFAALLSNLSHMAYFFFIAPEYHVGTLIGAGVLLLLFEIDQIKTRSYARIIAYGIVSALIVLSDSLVIALFVLPYAIYQVYRYINKKPVTLASKNKKETLRANSLKEKEIFRMNIVVLSMALLSGFAWFFKTYCGELYKPQIFWVMPTNLATSNIDIAARLSGFFSSLAVLLNENLSNVLQARLDMYGIAVTLLLSGLLAYAFINRNKKAGYLYFMFAVSALVMVMAFIITDYAAAADSSRFLIFTAVSAFAVIALAYRDMGLKRDVNTLFVAGIILLVLSTIPASIMTISGLDYQPNKADYEVIDYLKANHLTAGVSDYTEANKLTYLSHEDVRIRQVEIDGATFHPYALLSAARWYQDMPADITFLVNEDHLNEEQTNLLSMYKVDNVYRFKNYTIYYDNPNTG